MNSLRIRLIKRFFKVLLKKIRDKKGSFNKEAALIFCDTIQGILNLFRAEVEKM